MENQKRQTIPWHRLIGLTTKDMFDNTAFDVELETDLSVKTQLLDILIIRRRSGNAPELLPDGLENLLAHNLITYKSHHEALDRWAIDELVGHYVDYRKKISPSLDRLIPEENFRLYAVCTRFPEKVAEMAPLEEAGAPGVYKVNLGIRKLPVIVLSRLKPSEKNAPWLLFSAVPDKVQYGAEKYEWKTKISTIMNRLFEKYNIEGITMPYTVEDYFKETREEIIGSLTEADIDRILKGLRPEDRLRGLRPEDRLRGLRPEEVLSGFRAEEVLKEFKPEDRLRGLRPEDRLRGLRPEDVFKRFSQEEIEAYLKHTKQRGH